MQRFLYDYFHAETNEISLNELFCASFEDAITFLDSHFLEIHAERETDIREVRLRTSDDEVIMSYTTHFDALTSQD